MLLSISKQKSILFFTLTVLTIFQLFQINHWLYFGTPLSYENIMAFLTHVDDVWMDAKAASSIFYYLSALLIISCVIQMAYIQKKVFYTFQKGSLFLPFFLCSIISFSFIKGPQITYLRPSNPSLYNSIHLFTNIVTHEIWGGKKYITYKPYTHTLKNIEANNIVFVIGESTNARFLSLYGYPYQTTPYLEQQKNKSNFAHTIGVASSVATHASLPLFFNIVREPLNCELLHHKKVNLIKMAKQQGFQTVYITAQGTKDFSVAGLEFFDEIIEVDGRVVKGDHEIINHLNNIKLSTKNFIVVQPWVIHSPYNLFHGAIQKANPNFTIDDPQQKSYATALLYFDEWIQDLRSAILNNFPTDTLLIFSSDHGELLNENNQQGHMTLCSLGAEIATFAFGPENHPFLKWMNQKKHLSHYDLGIQLANLIGVDIQNPNDDHIHRFIHQPYFYNKSFQVIRWKEENNQTIYEKINIH